MVKIPKNESQYSSSNYFIKNPIRIVHSFPCTITPKVYFEYTVGAAPGVQELHDHEFGIKLVSIRIVLFHRFS